MNQSAMVRSPNLLLRCMNVLPAQADPRWVLRVAQDDIWSEVEVEADASLARRRAKLKEHAAKEHAAKAAAREQAAREKAERETPPFSPASRAASGGSGGDGIPGSDGAARDEQADDLAYDDDDLLEAWDELCAEEDGGRGMVLDVDGVAQLLTALGKPVGCYELQYIVSKVGDEQRRRLIGRVVGFERDQ